MADDPYDLERFVSAQDGMFDSALREITASRKTSHWMWSIFPQLRGIGLSPTAQCYGLGSIQEARAYIGHPVTGERLTRCAEAAIGATGRSLHEIFGSPDDM